jgi:uncharacterized protein involved in outer membrane biogenesis
LLLVIVVLVVAAIALAPFVPLAPLKPAVESRLSASLGRKVSVGSMHLSLLGGPFLYIDGMTASEDPAFGEGKFMEADEVRANIALVPLVLRRQVIIEGIRIKSPKFIFIKNDEGAWSWSTMGRNNQAAGPRSPGGILFSLIVDAPAGAALNDVHVEGGSVRLVDRSGAQPPESLYKNVEIHASGSSRTRGVFRAQSDESDGAELLRAELPFDLLIDRSGAGGASVQGTLGPGRLESKNFAADSFKSQINMKGSSVNLAQMEIALYEGTLRGSMDLDLSTQRFSAEGRVENLNLDEGLASKLQMPGQLRGHVNADYRLAGEMRGFQQSVQTIEGGGRMSSGEMFIASVNVSEQVARALQISEIGDMSPGTGIGSIEADFRIEQGVVRTSNLTIQQLDGLGDARATDGWFQVAQAASSPTLNYAATVTLSQDATAKVKASNPLIGMAVTIFENNKRVAVPVSITGEVRNPQVQVDVSRIF